MKVLLHWPPKSVPNHCVLEIFHGVFAFSLCFFNFFMGNIVILLSQISPTRTETLSCPTLRLACLLMLRPVSPKPVLLLQRTEFYLLIRRLSLLVNKISLKIMTMMIVNKNTRLTKRESCYTIHSVTGDQMVATGKCLCTWWHKTAVYTDGPWLRMCTTALRLAFCVQVGVPLTVVKACVAGRCEFYIYEQCKATDSGTWR